MGARNVAKANEDLSQVSYNKADGNSASVLPIELSNLNTVKAFATETLAKLGEKKIDYLLLNAGIGGTPSSAGPYGASWIEPLIVNHVCEY